MNKSRAPKTRTELHAIISDLPSSGLEIHEIVSILRRDHHKIIKEESADITDIGLTKLATDVSRWRSGAVDTTQLAFSEEFNLPKTFTIRVSIEGEVKRIHKKREHMSVSDGKAYVKQHIQKRKPSHDIDELNRLIEFVEAAGAKPNDKLIESWVKAKAAKEQDRR